MRKNILVAAIVLFGVFSYGIIAKAATFDNNLYYGIQGSADVEQLQSFLTNAGVYTGPVNGNFFSMTKAAVQEYQTEQGVTPASGFFGPITRAVANNAPATGTTTTTVGRAVPGPTISSVPPTTISAPSSVPSGPQSNAGTESPNIANTAIIMLSIPPATTSSGLPVNIEFGTLAQTIPLGTCLPVEAVVDNNMNKPTLATSNLTVTTDQGGGKIGFYSDPNCSVKSSSFVIKAGGGSGWFYIAGLATGSYSIRVSAPGLNAHMQTDTISAATTGGGGSGSGGGTGTGGGTGGSNPTSTTPTSTAVNTGAVVRMGFTMGPLSVPENTCAQVGVVLENSASEPTTATTNTTVTTDQGSSNVGFYSNATCTTKSSTFVIPAGSGTGVFYIESSVIGTWTIRASAPGGGSIMQAETITLPTTGTGFQNPPTTAPAVAAAAGYNSLVFDDEFNNTSTISPTGTGSYNWYLPNFYGSGTLPASGYSVQNGYLTIKTDLSGYSDGLVTADPSVETLAGHSWQYGYFEASIRYNQLGHTSGAWPAFWSYSLDQLSGQVATGTPFAELDFMECYPNGTKCAYITTVHQWQGSTSVAQNSNNLVTLPAGTDLSQFHTYGCLWTPTEVEWFFDNKLVTSVAVGPGTSYTALDNDHMALILGTGTNWPMDVDYVHVWH